MSGKSYWVFTETGGYLHGPNTYPPWIWHLLSYLSLRVVIAYEKVPGFIFFHFLYWLLYDKVHKRFFYKASGY